MNKADKTELARKIRNKVQAAIDLYQHDDEKAGDGKMEAAVKHLEEMTEGIKKKSTEQSSQGPG